MKKARNRNYLAFLGAVMLRGFTNEKIFLFNENKHKKEAYAPFNLLGRID